MQKNSSVSNIFKPVGKLLSRFHLTIFILFVVALLAAAVLFLYQILNDATVADDYQSPITAGSIDQTTLNRIDALHASDGTLPERQAATTRNNPFSE
ncbi:hypothetical protein CMN23_03380 [Candidatus Saccharibacteria bacterium]|nr:hypothetical protein [Candidatus Saccharibacteria bacterium]|tara:strand:- start:7064 stop:7354 length:291 start_codon:yes stop_codon:yes gene_type:complete